MKQTPRDLHTRYLYITLWNKRQENSRDWDVQSIKPTKFEQTNEITDSAWMLSILQALEKLNTDHPLLIQLQRMFPKIDVDQKEIVFMWVPGHVGIRGNEAAVRTAKEVHHKRRTDDLLPFFRPVYLGMEWNCASVR